jgi:SPP1 gp7 family putative phage head morphogenesis protein
MTTQVDFKQPPAEALKFFRQKGLLPSFAHQDVINQEHDRGFTVAKMTDIDLLKDVRDYVDYAIREGLTTKDFIDGLRPELERRGWWGVQLMVDPLTQEQKQVQLGSARRLKVIYETNQRTAYAAGQWERIERTKAAMPYIMYTAVLDGRVRPAHAAWNGKVLRADDPWWQTHTPPNGWNCRCSVVQLSERMMKRTGKDAPDEAPPVEMRDWTNPRTGEVMQVPAGVDPGFGYAFGASNRAEEARALLREKAAQLPDDMRKAALAIANRPTDAKP